MTTSQYFDQYVYLTSSCGGKINDTHPLGFVAGGLGPTKYIPNHRETIKFLNKDIFIESMDNELDNMFENEVYDLVKRGGTLGGHYILRYVWSHRREILDSTIHRHISRLYDGDNAHKYDI